MEKTEINFTGINVQSIEDIMRRVYMMRAGDFTVEKRADSYAVVVSDDTKTSPKMSLMFNKDSTVAYLSLYPSINFVKGVTEQDVVDYIQNKRVTHGIDSKAIKEAVETCETGLAVINKPVAFGKAASPGVASKLDFKVDWRVTSPTYDEYGSIDFKELNKIKNVYEGDLLLVKYPLTEGKNGLQVNGNVIVPLPGEDVKINVKGGIDAVEGENGEIRYIASKTGFYTYNPKNGDIEVNPLYTVQGSVDYTTGNIDFNGSVHVKGDVQAGFTVSALYDVIVDGVFQDGKITSGENIYINSGAKGTGRGIIKADKDVHIGYIENTHVYAKGNIYLDKYSYNSNLVAGDKVIGTSKKVAISGGKTQAFKGVEVTQLGAQGTSSTKVLSGFNYFAEENIQQINKKIEKIKGLIANIKAKLDKLEMTNPTVVKNPAVIKMLQNYRILNRSIIDLTNKAASESHVSENPYDSLVIISGITYENTVIKFPTAATRIDDRRSRVLYYVDPAKNSVDMADSKSEASVRDYILLTKDKMDKQKAEKEKQTKRTMI